MKRASRQELFLLDSALPLLIEHPWSMGYASMDQVASTHAGINDLIICPSVGMEDVNDLIEDPDFAMSFSYKAAQDVVLHVTQECLPGNKSSSEGGVRVLWRPGAP